MGEYGESVGLRDIFHRHILLVAFDNLIEIRQLPILPSGGPLSTFGNAELNFCVRNGNRWILCFIITGMAPLVGLEGKSGL